MKSVILCVVYISAFKLRLNVRKDNDTLHMKLLENNLLEIMFPKK